MSKRTIGIILIIALGCVMLASCDEAIPASAEQPTTPTSAGIVIDDEPIATVTAGRPGGENVLDGTAESTAETSESSATPTEESTTLPETPMEQTPETTPEPTAAIEPTTVPVDTIEQGRTIADYDTAVLTLAFSPDGRWLATGGEDTIVHIWDITSGTEVVALTDLEAWVTGVGFSNEGTWFAAATDDGQLRWWVVDTMTDIRPRIRRSDIHVGTIVGSVFSPIVPEMMVTIDANDGLLYVWNTVTYAVEATIETDIRPFALAVHPSDEAIVAVAGANDLGGMIQVWDVLFRDPVAAWSPEYPVLSIAYHPDGERIATGSDNGVSVWQVSNPTEPVLSIPANSPVRALAFNPDGTQLAFVSGDRVQFIDIDTGNVVTEIVNDGGEIYTLAYSPDGTLLATGDVSGNVRLWRVGES